MIAGLRVLGLIPARGGSKRLPGKNLREAGGKPLIAYTIEAARQSETLDRVVLTSDDPDIMAVAAAWGCEVPFRRPAHLATDAADGVAPVIHALEQLPGYDLVVLLQPTSPLRSTADIDACVALCAQAGVDSVVSVAPIDKKLTWMYHLGAGARMTPVVPVGTPEPLPTYVLNGAVYVFRREWVLATRQVVDAETRAYVMPPERSIDIDTELDFQLFSALLAQRDQAPGGAS